MQSKSVAVLLSLFLVVGYGVSATFPAGYGVDVCGGIHKACCGGCNFCYCCDGPGCQNGGNCVWYAWNRRCQDGEYLPWCTDAKTWNDYAIANDWPVGAEAQIGAIAVREVGTWGHVGYVVGVSGNTVYTDEQICTACGTSYSVARDKSYWDGGFIYFKSGGGYASVSQGVTVSPTPVVIGEDFTVSFTLKEIHGAPITFEHVEVAIHRSDGSYLQRVEMYDNVSIGANGTWSRSPTSQLNGISPGTYRANVSGVVPGGNWFDFSVTDSGVNPRSFTVENPVTLSYITISGSTQVNESSGAQYTCTAYYSDGSNSNVTSSASWSENSSYAGISSSGYLTTYSVSSDQSCTITASYGGKSDTHNVTIKNVPPTLSYITISGSTQVNENSGAQYTCTAYYSDGSTSNVTSSSGWSENSSYASISSSGYLTTSSVSSDQSCTITATYGGKSDTYSVTIKNVSQDVGSIRVSIVPQEAADAGAQWRVLGEGIWRNSGTIKSNVPFGTYTIEFKDISGWNTPPNKEVTVFAAVPNPWINSDPYTQICTYSISHANKSFDSTGGSGSVSVTTQSGCSWTAVSNATWITITSGSSGSGNGTVYYSVFANTGSSSRTGTMTIAGKTFTVTQTEFVSCEFDISDPEIILLTVPTEVEIGKSYTGQVRLKDDLGLQTWDVQIYDGAMDECKFRIENEAVSGKDTIKSFTFEVGSDWVQGNGLIEIVAIDVCNKGSRVYHTDFNIKPATATKDELAIDFKTAGIYVYNTGSWNRIYQGVDPEGLCSFGTYLAVDFGTTYGLYVYDAGAWTRVHKGVAIEKMAGFGGKLAVDFGTSYPLYEYNFITDTWTPIYTYSSPRDTIEALGDKLVVDFKTAGIYVYDAGSWNRIYKGVDPVNIVSFGDKLAIDFGTAYGLYVYEYDTDNWTRVYKGVAIEKMAEIDRDLAIDFGTAYGLYVYEFDTDNWTRVYKGVAIEKMAGFDGNLAVDFGTTYPIYEYDFDTNNWNSIYQYSSPRDELVPANIFD